MQQTVQILCADGSTRDCARALHTALGGERGPSAIVPSDANHSERLHLAMADALLGRRTLVFFARAACAPDRHEFCILRRELDVRFENRTEEDNRGTVAQEPLDGILIARKMAADSSIDAKITRSCPHNKQCLPAEDTPEIVRRIKNRINSADSSSISIPHSTVNVVNRLAAALQADGDEQSARDLYKLALEVSRSNFGDTDPVTLLSMNRYASLLLSLKDLQGACSVQRVLYHVYNECLNRDDPERTLSAANLFVTLIMLGYEGEAELVFHSELKWLIDEPLENLTGKQIRIRTLLLSVTTVRPVSEIS